MSTKFPEYKGLNLPNVAKEMLKYWEENNIFEKSMTIREGNKPYVFLKDRHQPMDYREFITCWPELLKIFFHVIKL